MPSVDQRFSGDSLREPPRFDAVPEQRTDPDDHADPASVEDSTTDAGSIPPMTDLQRRALLFQASWRPRAGGTPFAEEIKAQLGVGLYAYRRALREACQHPAAEKLAPHVVRARRAKDGG